MKIDSGTQTGGERAPREMESRRGAGETTVLENGDQGSPKIILTSESAPTARRSIEILQENDDIRVIVKGDVKITRGQGLVEDSESDSSPAAPKDRERALRASPDSLDGRRTNSGRKNSLCSDSLSRGTPERRGSSPKRYQKLKHLLDERKMFTDFLHQKNAENLPCSASSCLGSILSARLRKPRSGPQPKEEVLVQAKDFVDQYYASIKRLNTPFHQKRWQEVVQCIEKTGTYELTSSELTFGAKTAWRNAPRCIGRIQWSKLQVFDARHITTARGMFEAICNHIKYGTNKGNIRSAITIFPQRTDGKHDFRVWNPQLIRYAGYKQPDDTVAGDPVSVEFTEVCQNLGWKGDGGRFDVLPLVLQANGQDPEWFEIPKELVLEVNLKHPNFPWFEEMGLKWYALPGVSALLFDCGGLEFPAVPFNGWYMGTEIGARNLCDSNRYNITEVCAKYMGLDSKMTSSLWKDRVTVEVNIAVLYSFQSANVTIADHHSAAESFMKHFENEQRLRGGCPADWVWIVPPISGSLTPVFHQEMLNYNLKPSYEYQVEPWKTHVWKKDREKSKQPGERPKRKFGFREIARAVKFSAKLMGKALARRVKCTILYASETGKSERFGRTLCEIFKHAFDAKVQEMEKYDVIDLEHEALVLIVTSTFGNGDPPENGESFAKSLYELKHPGGVSEAEFQATSYIRMSVSSETDMKESDSTKQDHSLQMETGPLGNVRFSVFGLGSRAYPNFCAFGHYMDKILSELGGERIFQMVEGDELCGQEESFKNWAQGVFKAACDTFCLQDDVNIQAATGALLSTDFSWSLGKFRLTPVDGTSKMDICSALSVIHGKTILSAKIVERRNLQAPNSSRQTILINLDTNGASELSYVPGDHLGIYSANDPRLVEAVLARLYNAPQADSLVRLEVFQERQSPFGSVKSWTAFEKFPSCTLRTAFTHFLDITTPPSQMLLQLLAVQASSNADRQTLELLGKDPRAYEDWKQDLNPNLAEVLQFFPSLRIPPSLLMTQLPLLQQRFYSISSSPKVYPGEIHLTVAVVKYKTQGGCGPVHHGVCSSWLNGCAIGSVVPCLVRSAPNFRMPEDGTKPMIMVGPGTGIAPFRSFWQQRRVDREMLPEPKHGEKKGWGHMTIYFGCRQAAIDNIYASELKQIKAEGTLTNYYVALSREVNQKKVYVQDIMKRHSKEICDAIVKQGGHIYVCGDVSMASDVSDTVEMILREEAGMASEDAKNYVLKLRDANRFNEDIFGVTLRTSEVTHMWRDRAKQVWKNTSDTSKDLEEPDSPEAK
uniref:Nitric oxide synthase n=1 Tax=Nautilus pompilius TaxID=34573 RepID=A0A6G5T3J0_9MOLL|nr:Nitric Oxide Synthase 1 [Nautilus pompilius]